jgi:hypothetical protein
MKPDGMLVESEHVTAAFEEVATRGGDESLAELAQTEPALAAFIGQQLIGIAGKLALSGAPTPVVTGLHADLLTTVLTSIQALRRGHYQFWRETLTGTRLAQLDEQFQAPKQRTRKKKPDSGTAG